MQQYRDYWQHNNNASQLNVNSWCQKHWIIKNFHNPELFNSFWIYWTLHLLSCFLDFHNNYKDCCVDSREHSETWTPEIFITITKWTPNTLMVILIIFIPWTFLQYFLNEGGKIWTIGETGQLAEFFMEYSVKVPKPRYPSHANSRDKESLNSSTQAKPC